VYSGRHHGPYRVGFTPEEMAAMVHRTLSSMGLTHTFAPRIYIIAHGASSVNNPYYAGYDCGACSGRPGSVNARLFAAMANRPDVRSHLHQQYGLQIPAHTHFTGALHDTTRDEIEYYDLPPGDDKKSSSHQQFNRALQQALVHHARERALRFQNIAEGRPEKSLMRAIRNRSYTFFEPRPEWNHTDNALVIVGRPAVYERLYLDKRPFLNSYDYRQDPGGMALTAILSAAIPVCGGINLEYYFSRVDAQNWGAGTKLPHNVVGLFAVNNGIDGDVRPGLPSQMTEIHEPVRVLFIVEQKISVVNELLAGQPRLFEWVQNEWVRFAVLDPATGRVYTYEEGKAEPYHPLTTEIEAAHGPQSYRRVIQKSGPLLLCE
jgi:uncharacterized protein YbcC (UPF0753/DUF2309 family)